MKWLLFLLLLCATHEQLLACTCNPLKPLNAKILKTYKYVALVKIRSLESGAVDATGQPLEKVQLTIDVLENFREEMPGKILLDGYQSSCDMGLQLDEEWLVFLNEYKGYPIVWPCGYSSEYKDKDGRKDFHYHAVDTILDSLRHWTGRPVGVKEGTIEEFYANHRQASKEVYKHGKLEGERLIWHSNEKLWGKEFYMNGQKDGLSSWWYADGSLESKETFANGMPVDTSWYWYEIETDRGTLQMYSFLSNKLLDSVIQLYTRRQLLHFIVYNRCGEPLYSKGYHRNGKLGHEQINDPDNFTMYSAFYNDQGIIQSVRVANSKTQQRFYELNFGEDGTQRGFY